MQGNSPRLHHVHSVVLLPAYPPTLEYFHIFVVTTGAKTSKYNAHMLVISRPFTLQPEIAAPSLTLIETKCHTTPDLPMT